MQPGTAAASRSRPAAEYTAAAFAEPLKRVFTGFYRPTHEVTVDVHPCRRTSCAAITLRADFAPWMEQTLYAPSIRAAALGVEPDAAPPHRVDPLVSGAAARRAAVLLLVARWIR